MGEIPVFCSYLSHLDLRLQLPPFSAQWILIQQKQAAYAFRHVYVLSQFSCVRLFHPVDRSPPGSAVHGILQARILAWVSMPSSRGSSPPRGRSQVSCVSFIGSLVLYHQCHLKQHCYLPLTFCCAALSARTISKQAARNGEGTPILLIHHSKSDHVAITCPSLSSISSWL